MKKYLLGVPFSILALLLFILLRNEFSLWTSFLSSVLATLSIFCIYLIKSKPLQQEVVQLSVGIGLVYLLLSSMGITIFPRENIRDLGDIVMPYIYSILFSFLLAITLLIFGLLLVKIRSLGEANSKY
ncbi:hypothetical protein [Rossellomorea aquimaris]|uniref:hypothetical protein n=1 Tax=Rossellomorea aquimaris TaxID=189382 RepID=UPI0007D0A3F5|nr:hypothetical protein [Rossellomorea aquimaris]